jgi:4-amino-4-deoxy-L-arabinose transferase-like glycosyltransferase
VSGDRRSWWLLVAGALTLTAVGNWRVLSLGAPALQTGALWWVSGLATLAVAAWVADRGVGHAGPGWNRTDTAAVLVVLAAAAVYRLWGIGRYPPPDAFGFEEFQAGGLAYNTLHDWWGVSLEFPLTNLLPALSFRLFGLSSFALRAPFVLSGIVAPVFVYLALRRVVERPAAWAGAMLLATNRWAALAARFADEIFLPVSLVAIAAWLLAKLLQERRQLSAFALALVASDFFYAYSGYRALPLIAFAGAVWLAVAPRWRVRAAPRSLEVFVLVVAVWAITLSPGVTTSWATGSSSFFEALQRHEEAWGSHGSLVARAATAVGRLRHGWEVFALQGDELPTLNLPYEPMFDPLSAALATLALLAALWRWRDPSRWLTLAMVGVPFLGLALIPANVNVSRYFVLIVPLFCLTACFLDDLRRWLGRVGPAVLGVVVVLVAGLNWVNLRRVIDSPVVQEGFQFSENTVLAAIHAVPPGSRVVLLTVEGSVAFEPSDYRWFTAHADGGRPVSLAAALSVPAESGGPLYWITQGVPEAHLLPQLVALSCPGAAWKVVDAPRPEATVGVSWVETTAGCHALLPLQGLRGVYAIVGDGGAPQEVRQVDPALCAYTIPWPLAWKLEDRQIRGLQVQWEGTVTGPTPGEYQFRLEVEGASGRLRVGEAEARVTAPVQTWASTSLPVQLGVPAVALSVLLDAEPGASPRVRLSWTPPGGGPEEIIPPSQLRPAA